MFLSKLIDIVPLDIDKLLLEQQETIKKADALLLEVEKLKNNSEIPKTVKDMYDASNTLQNPIFDMSQNSLMIKAEKFFDGIDKVTNYITHPILIFNAIAGASYWICGIIAIAGILYYIIGFKKGLKWTGGSLLTYTLIKAINCGLNAL